LGPAEGGYRRRPSVRYATSTKAQHRSWSACTTCATKSSRR